MRISRFHARRAERGISVGIVAVCIFALVGFAALAIDLVTLYVAKSQAQKVADAAALAGAKTLVEYGITADPLNTQGQWGTACTEAIDQATTVAGAGLIGGSAPAVVTPDFGSGGSPATCPTHGPIGTGFAVNPQMKVTVQSKPLPLFFAKIWGSGSAQVKASGLAEAFNPSGTDIPVASRCVRPWLLPNIDPNGGPIFYKGSGRIANNEPSTPGDVEGAVGRAIQLTTGCTGICGAGTVNAPAVGTGPPKTLSFYPLDLPNPAAHGPSCSVGVDYQNNITACNPNPIACGQMVNLETTADPTVVVDNQTAINCLINKGNGTGQDTLNTTNFPYQIDAGSTHSGVTGNPQISTSRSVVTIPVYDSGAGVAPGTTGVEVIGFVQAFVDGMDANGQPTIHILNVSGCSATARASSTTPVGLGEGTPVPVRLIHP